MSKHPPRDPDEDEVDEITDAGYRDSAEQRAYDEAEEESPDDSEEDLPGGG